MKRFVLALVLCGLAAGVVPAYAQEQHAYSPPPMAPNEFTDPAMTFKAIDGYVKIPFPPHDPMQFDQPAVVAGFIYHPRQQDAREISIEMDNFQGSLSGYEMVVENDLRDKIDGVFFKKKQLTTLSNGMPAYWQDITIGSGFDTYKRFQYVWIDGVRGVQLTLTARLGEITEDQAKAALANVRATAYPVNRF
ncbi:MAG TPA: hypothetical protein VIO32_11625 [Candidatus Baltobacteraceae bacterium]